MSNIIKYRPDIDGLRALAVLMVVFYHVKFSWIPGGFVGVDVFFVISGFLITTILRREIGEGTFSLKAFYLRRFRRLLPAFIVVVIVSTLFIGRYYLPKDFYLYSKSIVYAFAGISNFLFLRETDNYFAPEVSELPLLHTWSLAVEEQFYLFWPLMLILLTKFPKVIAGIIVGIAFVGFSGLSQWMAGNYAAAAYYLLPARVFELMMGSLLSIALLRMPPVNSAIAHGFSLIGLVLILGTGLTLTSEQPFPGLNAFWPCLGTVILIWTGNNKTQAIGNQFLSLKPMVAVGLISYSFYLWHWPPIALLNYLNVDLTTPIAIALILATAALSWLTWRFVEIPFREKITWKFAPTLIVLLVVPISIAQGMKSYLNKTNGIGFESRFVKNIRDILPVVAGSPSDLFKACYRGDATNFEQGTQCLFGATDKSDKLDFILIGDSHANSARGFFEVLAKDAGLVGLEISKAAIPYLVGTKVDYVNKESRTKTFMKRNNAIREYIDNFNGVVIAAGNWTGYENSPTIQMTPGIREGISATVSDIRRQGNPVIILKAVPIFKTSRPALCHLDLGSLAGGSRCDLKLKDVHAKQKTMDDAFASVVQQHPEVIVMDLKDVLCDETDCYPNIGEIPIYQDESHMSYLGSAKAREVYLEKIGNPLRAYGAALKTGEDE